MLRRHRVHLASLAVALFVCAVAGVALAQTPVGRSAAPTDLDRDEGRSVVLIENTGQFPENAAFQVWGGPATVWLAEDAVWVTLVEAPAPSAAAGAAQGVHVRLSFVDADPRATLAPSGRLSTAVTYFKGSDPARWRRAPAWSSVRYMDLYPGVDLVLDGSVRLEQPSEGGGDPGELLLPWRLDVRPATDSPTIRLRIDGAEAMRLPGNRLGLRTAIGDYALVLPASAHSYHVEAGTADGSVSVFDVVAGAQPARQPAAVDPPNLAYSTFLGGSQFDSGEAMAVDPDGRATVVGGTLSTDFPTTPGAFAASLAGGTDVFVARFNPAGTALETATFVGGGDLDTALSVAVDPNGRTVVSGATDSSDFPVTAGAYDTLHNGQTDGFVLRLDPTGAALEFSTYLGGVINDYARAVALDSYGRAVVAGQTDSANFPSTAGAYDPVHNGSTDAFAAILDASGSNLVASSFLGGASSDEAYGLALDTSNQVYLTGKTSSMAFPHTARFGPPQAPEDVFVARMDASLGALPVSVLLTGSDDERGQAIEVDSSGRACVTGFSQSADFPTTPGSYDPTFNGTQTYEPDAIVACLDASGSALVYSTFLGGRDRDAGLGLALDADGRAFVTGYTDTATATGRDAFVTGLNTAGSALVYDVRLAGADVDEGHALVLDGAGAAYVAGRTRSSNFPVTAGSFDTGFNAVMDAFASKLVLPPPDPTPTPSLTATETPTATPTSTGTPTPTATEVQTATPTATPTRTATATVTRTATPTPSPTPARRYFPLMVRNLPG